MSSGPTPGPGRDRRGAQVVALTGGTSGIGRATVEALLDRGADVVFVGRDRERSHALAAELGGRYPERRVAAVGADLSVTGAVRDTAQRIRVVLRDWDAGGLSALINNAAFVSTWRMITAEGYEQQFAVNHLAPFLLTRELLPVLETGAPGRVIVLSSGSHRGARVRWDDPMLTRGYSLLRAYRQSKLANALFCMEFNRRHAAGSGVRAYAVDPGLVRTGIGSKESGGIERLVWKLRTRSRKAVEPEVPARAIAELAAAAEVDRPEHWYRRRDEPAVPDAAATDAVAGARLWALSERLCDDQPQEEL